MRELPGNRSDGDRFGGREICLSSNEDSLTIVDVTDKDNPVQLSRTEYEGSAYTHQGWLTPDRRHFLLDDELDEQEFGGQTRTYIFNVERLDQPSDPAVYHGVSESIDHNLYTKGSRAYQANYRSGLRVLDTSRVAEGALSEVGFFDIYPEDDEPEFNGAWSNYPYFASGNVIVSGIEQGLFVLRPSAEVAGEVVGSPDPGPPAGPPADQGSRFRARLGKGAYGRVRRGAFLVRCRATGTGPRTCRVRAVWRRGKRARVVGRGHSVLRGRSARVRVRLNALGRRLVARRPGGVPVTLRVRVSDGQGRTATSSRRAKLRLSG